MSQLSLFAQSVATAMAIREMESPAVEPVASQEEPEPMAVVDSSSAEPEPLPEPPGQPQEPTAKRSRSRRPSQEEMDAARAVAMIRIMAETDLVILLRSRTLCETLRLWRRAHGV